MPVYSKDGHAGWYQCFGEVTETPNLYVCMVCLYSLPCLHYITVSHCNDIVNVLSAVLSHSIALFLYPKCQFTVWVSVFLCFGSTCWYETFVTTCVIWKKAGSHAEELNH